MNGIDIAIIVIVSVLFAAAVGYLIYRKVKHKGVGCDCGGNCGSCGACGACRSKSDGNADGENAERSEHGHCPHCGNSD